jgi:hypothetical protein
MGGTPNAKTIPKPIDKAKRFIRRVGSSMNAPFIGGRLYLLHL